MNPPDPQGGPSESTSSNGAEEEQGAGCLPGILAAMALCGILGFITCGAMTWYIFANQDQLALRALTGSFIPAVEQSFLNPEEKSNTVDQLKEFAKEIERGQGRELANRGSDATDGSASRLIMGPSKGGRGVRRRQSRRLRTGRFTPV